MKRRYSLVVTGALWLAGAAASQAEIIDFDDLPSAEHPLPPDSYYNGVGVVGSSDFQSHGANFNNVVDPTFFTWGGWAYANLTDTPANADPDQPDYTYQYSAAAGVGSRGSAAYGVAYVDPYTPTTPRVILPAGTHPLSLQVTNSTYDALSMLHGDDFSKKFAGPSGATPGDWFKLTITGLDAGSLPIGSVDFYLADFRSGDAPLGYVVETWRNVNLTSLYNAQALSFTLTSSDNGAFGMNTPAYFAADDLSVTTHLGDVSGDSIVNGQDIATIASHWLLAGPVGDANGDGLVNGQDIATIAANWLAGTGPAQGVPEPASALLAALGLALLAVTTKLRR